LIRFILVSFNSYFDLLNKANLGIEGQEPVSVIVGDGFYSR
jgi:hypothetical protein